MILTESKNIFPNPRKHILVLGGAGYIGSHICEVFESVGHYVVVYDNLSGCRVPYIPHGRFVFGDTRDTRFLSETILKHNIDTVIHLADPISVQDSIANPEKYNPAIQDNLQSVLAAMAATGCTDIIYFSSAAVYGCGGPCPENYPIDPESPYAEAKVEAELILSESWVQSWARTVVLRPFNVAGASTSGKIGESHKPETHLIPRLIKSTITGDPIIVYGDGEDVRDYIHVSDVASACLTVFESINEAHGQVFNVSVEQAKSINQIISMVGDINRPFVEYRKKVKSSPFLLTGDSAKLRALGWCPKYSIKDCISSAYQWIKSNG